MISKLDPMKREWEAPARQKGPGIVDTGVHSGGLSWVYEGTWLSLVT